MRKAYEVAEWSLNGLKKEYQVLHHLEISHRRLSAGRAKPSRWVSTRPSMESYEALKTNLLTRYPDGRLKTILFIGTAHGDGVSTTAINFAASLASDRRLKVLLIEANLRTPSLHDVFRIDHVHALSDLVAKDDRGEEAIEVKCGNLHVIPCGGNHAEPVSLFQSNGFDRVLQRARDNYDYVILDAPPVHGYSEWRALCAKVDGVVLVIQSGKTRWQIALSAKKQLLEAGGTLLGVVLNKRKYYIPEFIYRRL